MSEVKKGKARLAATHRLIYQYKFSLEQLAFFAERLPEKDMGIAAWYEYHYRVDGPRLAHEFTYPIANENQGGMIRCVHEGVCPECGRRGYLIRSEQVKVEQEFAHGESEVVYDYPPDGDDRVAYTVQCAKGHCYTAEPTLHDWVAFRDTPLKREMRYG